MSIEQTLAKVTSNISNEFNTFFGNFEILPDQFIHLNKYKIIITKTELKIINNIDNTNPKIYSFDIDTARLRFFKGELLPSIRVKLLSLNKYNVESFDIIGELLENVLYLKPPTTIYITRHDNYELYSIKNMNMATLFLIKKID